MKVKGTWWDKWGLDNGHEIGSRRKWDGKERNENGRKEQQDGKEKERRWEGEGNYIGRIGQGDKKKWTMRWEVSGKLYGKLREIRWEVEGNEVGSRGQWEGKERDIKMGKRRKLEGKERELRWEQEGKGNDMRWEEEGWEGEGNESESREKGKERKRKVKEEFNGWLACTCRLYDRRGFTWRPQFPLTMRAVCVKQGEEWWPNIQGYKYRRRARRRFEGRRFAWQKKHYFLGGMEVRKRKHMYSYRIHFKSWAQDNILTSQQATTR